jgi:hypothetical protein
MSATDGNELYCWQVQEPGGEWSMVGRLMANPATGTAFHTPLIHRNRDVVNQMRPLAEAHAAATNQPLRLSRFTLTEVLEGRGR